MPDRKKHFPEAENNKYDVSNVLNVLNDGSSYRPAQAAKQAVSDDASSVEINLEEGAPFADTVDPQATIGEYMQRHEEEEAYLAEAEARESALRINEEVDPVVEEPLEEIAEEAVYDEAAAEDEPYVYEAPEQTVKSPIIREQAQKARDPFYDDLRSLDSEPAIQRMKAREEADENSEENAKDPLEEILSSPARRVKKPRFVKPKAAEEADVSEKETVEEEPMPEDKVEETVPMEDTAAEEEEALMEEEFIEVDDNGEEIHEDNLDHALAEARAAQRNSICEDLHDLQKHLEEARSPMMHRTEVLVPREKTLRLIRSLTAICDVDPSYIDGASEDMLIDRLACEHGEDDYEPLKRARCRAQTIIENATKQAQTIIGDAKVLATQLLAETEAEIKEKYDDADMQIAVRMDTAKEESSKKLNEARSELTTSRQHSVEILSKYLEKAEIDYQGYWERAENTVMASLEQSESILMKAAEIYRKELEVIRQDRDELSEILDHLKRYKRL